MKRTMLFLMIATTMLMACKKNNPKPEDIKINSLKVLLPDDLEEIELDYKNQSQKIQFEWAKAGEGVTYDVVFSMNKDLSQPYILKVGSEIDTDVSHLELDNILSELNVKEYNRGDIYWTVRGHIGEAVTDGDIRSMQVYRLLKPFTDPRDNEQYEVCRIIDPVSGDYAVWLAENLRAKKYSDGASLENYRFFESDDEVLVKAYGGYYDWNTVMRGNTGAEPSGKVQGIAPEGWHIPTKLEWDFVINNSDRGEGSGTELKNPLFWDTSSMNKGTNFWNFNMAGAGYIWTNSNVAHTLIEPGAFTYFWTATQPVAGDVFPWNPSPAEFPSQAVTYAFNKDDPAAALYPYPKERGFSVRCVLD